MWQNDRLWAGLAVAVGLLQAWDSGGFTAGPGVAVLVALGVLLPAAVIVLARRQEVRIAALVAGVALLTWARMASPVSLNTLHLSLFVPAIYVLVVSGLLARKPLGSRL
jgi:hypothetical protein